MTRTLADIRNIMKTRFVENPQLISLYELIPGQTFDQQFSTASLEMIWIESLATSIFEHEQIVSLNASNSRPQNKENFKLAILDYHDGLDLKWKDGQFQYDFTGITDVEVRKIIDRCAVLENNDGELVVKVATDNAGVLSPITTPQEDRLTFYIAQIKVPGVSIRIINKVADNLKTNLRVFVDPLMIDLASGKQLNVTGDVYPVKDALKDYLQNLEFNGAFVTNFMTRTIEDKNGINLVAVDLMQSSFDALPFSDFSDFKIPESGYFDISDANLTITYLPYVLVNN